MGSPKFYMLEFMSRCLERRKREVRGLHLDTVSTSAGSGRSGIQVDSCAVGQERRGIGIG